MKNIGLDLSKLGAAPSVTSKWDLQRAFTWRLFMLASFNGVLGYYVSQYCQDIVFGDYAMSELSMRKHGAFQRYYAGIQAIEAVDLVFLLPTDSSVQDYFYGWYERIIDRQGYYHPKIEYSRDMYLLLSDQSGSMTSTYRFKGAFPKNHLRIHPSYEIDDVMKASISLSVDGIVPTSLLGTIRKGAMDLLGNVVDVNKLERSVLGVLS